MDAVTIKAIEDSRYWLSKNDTEMTIYVLRDLPILEKLNLSDLAWAI